MTVLEIRTACPKNYDGLGDFRPVSVLNSMTSLFYQLQVGQPTPPCPTWGCQVGLL
jgi:hypothetical protein